MVQTMFRQGNAMTPEAWSTWYSGKLSQELGTKSWNGFGDRFGPTTSEVVAFVGAWSKPYSNTGYAVVGFSLVVAVVFGF
jgi:hypothetical protein